ncbi:MAG: serine/threonine protein kinase [Pirellulaceae bacterium]|nr:serine/threonine protein kinase [Pirellulaceae bacterium]
MNAQLHQRAKQLFAELCDLSREVQAQRLAELEPAAPEVVQEVRSLLNFHTLRTTRIPEIPAPKIRTRSTLSATYQSSLSSRLRYLFRWLWPTLLLGLIGLMAGYWTSNRVQASLRSMLSQRLTEQIDQHVIDLRQWESQMIDQALAWSRQENVVAPIRQLLELSRPIADDDSQQLQAVLCQAEAYEALQQQLRSLAGNSVRFAVWDRRMITVADWNQKSRPEVVGSFVTPAGAAMLTPVLRGQARMYLQSQSQAISENYRLQDNESELSVFLPITDTTGSVAAVLMVRGYGLDEAFNALVARWSTQGVGETYLVSDRGALLTKSRYAESLEQFDLATTNSLGSKQILIRDPGVNLLAGQLPDLIPTAWPPTLLAQQLTSGNNGMSVDGYRNYVGETVVGAWRWIPSHELGIAFEERAADAFGMATHVRRTIAGLTGLFTLALGGLTLLWMLRTSRYLQADLSDVGPYQVQELLGEGGMGRVYLAEHALLCRQSAVKVLSGPAVDQTAISRFEREVQLASQLTHPNTIAIYDFGRNQEGLFYYAMEYINGAHLGQLVEYSGALHPGRCIFILKQLCRALAEAHEVGVVHRDIKPQNIMVCNRGGEPDFVKLFDYGLVKAFAPGVSPTASQTKIVVGTPRFMAPERLKAPWLADPRVDIYSVGALAYFLLTGNLPPLFTLSGPSAHEQPGIETLDLPSAVVPFGELLGMCLSTDPSERPSSMQSLLDELEELSQRFPWSRQDSVVWWINHQAKLLQLVKSKRQKLAAKMAR